MKRFIDAGRAAIAANNLYAALSLALMIPDICGSLEDPGPRKSERRYRKWFEKWAQPKFTRKLQPSGEELVFITADDCYQLRCSLIHSGTAEIEPGKRSVLDRFIFYDKETGSHLTYFGAVVINGDKQTSLQLKADRFSETMYLAAEEWDASTTENTVVQAEKRKLLVIRSKGDALGGGLIAFG